MTRYFVTQRNTVPGRPEVSNESSPIEIASASRIAVYAGDDLPRAQCVFDNLREGGRLHTYEYHPDWAYSYPQENNLEIVQAYFADSEKQNLMLAVYKL